MNATEAMMLCRFAKAACPQQAIDEYTPDAWLELLGDLRFDDAKAALLAVAAKQPFVAPAEIRTEVARIRAKRIVDHPPLTPPPGLTELETRQWTRDRIREIGDGQVIDCDAAYDELKPRHLPDIRELMPRPEPDPAQEASA